MSESGFAGLKDLRIEEKLSESGFAGFKDEED